MNGFLVIFLVILLVYSVIWTGLKYWYYGLSEHSADVIWYVQGEPPASVSYLAELAPKLET